MATAYVFTFYTAITQFLSRVSKTDRCKAVERTCGDRTEIVAASGKSYFYLYIDFQNFCGTFYDFWDAMG